MIDPARRRFAVVLLAGAAGAPLVGLVGCDDRPPAPPVTDSEASAPETVPAPAPPSGPDAGGGSGTSAAPASDVVVFEVVDLPPGEGATSYHVRGGRLELRREPNAALPPARTVQLPSGAPLHPVSTRYRTVAPGRIEALRPARVAGRDLGRIRALTRNAYYSGDRSGGSGPGERRSWEVESGGTLLWLQNRAEGTCFLELDERIVEAEPCPAHLESFRVLTPPVVEWWIEVAPDDGARGWLLVDEAVEVRRSF